MGVRHYPILKMSIPFAEYKGKGFGVSFIECSEMELTQKTIDIYSDIGGDGTNNNVLMLSPVKHQYGGVDALNAKIHDSFVNGGALVLEQIDGSSITHHMLGRSLRVGDLVMYTKNDYTRDIRNGSVGKIIQQNQDVITVDFEGNIVDLSWSDLSNLEYAYALTVHKSQGSQYDRVVVVIKKSRNLDRHLIYTAITRAKHQVVFVGDFSQFELALTKSNALSRHTLLAQHIEHRKNTK
ncbi:ATP-dependent RecD-like DNA helicase [Shewanella sp. SM32]|uniref:ATP-dependent DNA helicase n=1 Tax=Shewanella sp. SM32 TaxID=2912796 RepID=UPI0021DAFD93|nr:ATP-dependent RecD-like DNA helicase [Shewanella sp. SM32]MCU8069390.1 ATP-dependent RecD-like DNA helicase [Shewanella sp. SM32]